MDHQRTCPVETRTTNAAAAAKKAICPTIVTANSAIATFSSETRGGWTIGIGGEYDFTDWLTGFAEYDYYGFGTRTVGFPVGPLVANFDVKESKSVFKVGLNFKFGGAPVVARY